ncbi:MAG: hypothetical protein HY540_06095 [Deltaproteobacteria bacterium]|nr:hypothetical protein [Deltaproteobacteria bacterium]
MKWIWIGIIIYAFIRLWRATRMGAVPRQRPQPTKKLGNEMIACKSCGTFILRQSALMRGGEPYCSEQCQKEKI